MIIVSWEWWLLNQIIIIIIIIIIVKWMGVSVSIRWYCIRFTVVDPSAESSGVWIVWWHRVALLPICYSRWTNSFYWNTSMEWAIWSPARIGVATQPDSSLCSPRWTVSLSASNCEIIYCFSLFLMRPIWRSDFKLSSVSSRPMLLMSTSTTGSRCFILNWTPLE